MLHFELRLRFTKISFFSSLVFFVVIAQAAVVLHPQTTTENDTKAQFPLIEFFCNPNSNELGSHFVLRAFSNKKEREALYETYMCETSWIMSPADRGKSTPDQVFNHGLPRVTLVSPCTSDTMNPIGSSSKETPKVYAYVNDAEHVLVGSNADIQLYGNDDDAVHIHDNFTNELRCYGSYSSFKDMFVLRISYVDKQVRYTEIIGKTGDDIILRIRYSMSFWFWLDRYDKRIPIENISKYSRNGMNNLIIKNASVDDMGLYTAKPDSEPFNSQTFVVLIKGLPFISISTESVVLQADEAFNISCTVISVDLVLYGSYFQKCHLTDDKELYCAETLERTYFDQVLRPMEKKYHYTYDILYKPVGAAGRVVCFAINKMGQANISASVYVTTANDLIAMSGIDLYKKIYENQQVTIRCDASADLYNEFQWFSNDTRVYSSNSVSVKDWISDNFLSTIIHFDQFRIPDGGHYECRAFPKNGEPFQNRSLDLYVNVNLTLHGFDPKNTIYEGQEFTVMCACSKLHFVRLAWFRNETEVLNSTDISVQNTTNSSDMQTTLHFAQIRILDGGTYECRALPFTGKACILPVDLHVYAQRSIWWLYSVLIITAVALFIVCMLHERRVSNGLRDNMLAAFAEEFENYIAPDSSCEKPGKEALEQGRFLEFPPERLTFGERIGSGAFGVVVKAQALGINKHESNSLVAVKRAKRQPFGNTGICSLASELRILIHLGPHLNVVSLLGAVTKDIGKSKLMIIVEYCRYGNIRKVIQENRDEFVNLIDRNTGEIGVGRTLCSDNIRRIDETNYAMILSTRDLLSWAYQVARGMSFLSSKRVIHSDLAARNVLLSDHKVVKICDFGLSRRMYKASVYQKGGKEPMPWKWMSPESARDRIFSVKSDVWSYGILLWEFFSLGCEPYGGDQFHPDFVARLRNGYRLEKPDYANPYLYDIMRNCWTNEPKDRPSFDSLTEVFASLMGDDASHYYLNFNDIPQKENISRTTSNTTVLAAEATTDTVELLGEATTFDPDVIE